MSIKFPVGILAATIIVLESIFVEQANAAHCYEGLRDCIAECNAVAPGSGGGASLECLTSCNEANNAIFSRGEECVKQEGEQGEEQIEEPQQQEQEDVTSDTPSPTLSKTVIRLVAGLDIREGETVAAKQGELLLVDFRNGSFIEVNTGASFSYKESKEEITFESLAGSIRYFFEGFTKPRYVRTSNAVTSVRGTDFVVNESEEKTEVLVFDGNLAVSDINGQNTVDVGPGYKTEVKSGGKPTKSKLFDSSKIDRWFDVITPENSQRKLGPRTWAIVAVIVIGGLVFIFFAIKKSLKRFQRVRK